MEKESEIETERDEGRRRKKQISEMHLFRTSHYIFLGVPKLISRLF
jgi:hypothetical protein